MSSRVCLAIVTKRNPSVQPLPVALLTDITIHGKSNEGCRPRGVKSAGDCIQVTTNYRATCLWSLGVFAIIFASISIETLCPYWEQKHSNWLQQLGEWSRSPSLLQLDFGQGHECRGRQGRAERSNNC